MKLLVNVVLIFLLLSTEISSNRIQCPDGIPDVPFTRERVVELRRQMTALLWSIPVPLSNDAQQLRDLLLTMSRSNVEIWERFSSISTFWIWTYLPTLAVVPPNLCSFSQLVDNTPSWNVTRDCTNMTNPITMVIEEILYGTVLIISNGLKNTGCGKAVLGKGGDLRISSNPNSPQAPYPLLTSNVTCVGDGRIYHIGPMLDFMGTSYNVPGATQDIKDILIRLYSSPSLGDNLIALMTLAAASPPLNAIVTNYRDEMKYTTFSLGSLSNLNKACCCKYRNDLKEIYEETFIEKERIYNFVLNEYCST